jgi:hypothetical protein
MVTIATKEDLDLISRCGGDDLSVTGIEFTLEEGIDPHEATAGQVAFVMDALDRVVAAGDLPGPAKPLPPIGTSVEVIMVGGKPSPPSRYAVGVVRSFEWDSYFRTWRVHVDFHGHAGGFYGNPTRSSSAFAGDLHVIGSDERSFSLMSPAEIEELYLERRDEFWRTIDPRTGLTDPSGRVTPPGDVR